MKIKIGGKDKKLSKKTIILNLVLDESGSMKDKRDSVISGVNEYMESVKNQNSESEFVVNVISFNDSVKYLHTGKSLDNIPKMNREYYNPEGSTALYDAVGEVIYQAESQRRLIGDSNVLTFIFTDGDENSSQKFTGDMIKSMIVTNEGTGDWTFTFIGASKECLKSAVKNMGVSWGNTIEFNPANFQVSMCNLAAATHTYTNNVARGINATQSFYKDAGLDNTKNLDEQSLVDLHHTPSTTTVK